MLAALIRRRRHGYTPCRGLRAGDLQDHPRLWRLRRQNKYTDAAADVAIPLTDLGIDPDTDLADQYAFTKVTASDENGVQRGSTWQCCPGLLVYRRDIAQDVFGTDDPEAIGEKVKDWESIFLFRNLSPVPKHSR